MGRILILLGPPGAGKGTQASRLSLELGFAHVSTGDLFRDNIKRKTPVGQRATDFMNRGELVPDLVVLDMLEARVAEEDCQSGCLLDGFPRTLPQAEALERVASERGDDLRALSLEVPDEVLVERLTGRRTCRENSSHIHHLQFSPPAVEGRCDTCGGELYQRPDDSLEVVSNRLAVYRKQTEPLIEFYADRGALQRVDGDREPDLVLAEIVRWAREAA